MYAGRGQAPPLQTDCYQVFTKLVKPRVVGEEFIPTRTWDKKTQRAARTPPPRFSYNLPENIKIISDFIGLLFRSNKAGFFIENNYFFSTLPALFLTLTSSKIMETPIMICPMPQTPEMLLSNPLLRLLAKTCVIPLAKNPIPLIFKPT